MTVFPWGSFVAMQAANNRRQQETKNLEEDIEKYNRKQVYFFVGETEKHGIVVDVYKGHALKIQCHNGVFHRNTSEVDFYPADVRYTAKIFTNYNNAMKEILNSIEEKDVVGEEEKEFYQSIRAAKQAFDKYYDL